MGTEKRQRQKEGRQARIAAAEAAQRKAATRQRIISFAGLAALIVVLIVAITYFTRDDNSSTDVASTDTSVDAALDGSSVSSSTDAPLESAAGKPCVALSDPLPADAPNVPVQVGPPPAQLVKDDLVVGTGEVVEPGATVTVNYIGVACSTGKIFDSSYERGTAATFSLAQVIPGWTQGIPGMKVGGQRLLGIPSELAYGADGSPSGGIAPDEALWFVVEVTNTVSPSTTTTAPASGGTSSTTGATTPST